MMSIAEKIAQIQEAPEHIRLRYTLVAVSICMIFVVGLWLLSLRQTLMRGPSTGAKQNTEAVTKTIEEQKQSKNSLTELLKRDQSVQVKNNALTGEEFLQRELQKERTSNVPNQIEE